MGKYVKRAEKREIVRIIQRVFAAVDIKSVENSVDNVENTINVNIILIHYLKKPMKSKVFERFFIHGFRKFIFM